MQRHRLFANAARVLDQLEFINQLITFILVLPTKGVGERPLLDLCALERMGSESRAGDKPGLMNVRAFSAVEPLFVAAKLEATLGQSHTFYRQQFVVDLHQQVKILLNGGGKGVDLARAGPFNFYRSLGSQLNRMFFDSG